MKCECIHIYIQLFLYLKDGTISVWTPNGDFKIAKSVAVSQLNYISNKKKQKKVQINILFLGNCRN